MPTSGSISSPWNCCWECGSPVSRPRRRYEWREAHSRRCGGRDRSRRYDAAFARNTGAGMGGAGPGSLVGGELRRNPRRAGAAAVGSRRSHRDLRADAFVCLSRSARRRDSAGAALVGRENHRRVPGDRDARGRRGAAARLGMQSSPGRLHAPQGPVAAQPRAPGIRAPGAAGVGAITPGEAVSSWGTSGTVLAATAQPRVDPGLRAHTFCHVAPGVWYVMGVVLSAGGAFAWYRNQCARELAEEARDDILVDEAAAIPPGAEGATFLPYLQGERTPHRDAGLRAAFVGLSLAHSRAHMTRAVLEGVCFALRDSIEILKALGLAPAHLLLTGGGAKNAFIRQLQADVFGLPVTTVNREEGGAYGAALLAAVGAGAVPDLQTAVQRTLARQPPTPPNPEMHRTYESIYDRFRKQLVAARA